MRTARLRGVTSLPTVWSKETVELFFSVIDHPRDLAIFVNIYGSGLRVSEICKLKIEDIDSKGMCAPVNQEYYVKIMIKKLHQMPSFLSESDAALYVLQSGLTKKHGRVSAAVNLVGNTPLSEPGIKIQDCSLCLWRKRGQPCR